MFAQKPYSAFTHLARSVLGARYHSKDQLFAMMTCYFDETADKWLEGDDKPHKFMFVCGYVARVDRWEKFEVEWKQYLAHYGVTDFHMTDYCSGVREYAKWPVTDPEFSQIRIDFMRDASSIVRKFASYAFVSAVADSVFAYVDQRYMLKEFCGSPYGLVGLECAVLARSVRSKLYADKNEFEYVFEDGGPDKAGLTRAMRGMTPGLPDPIFKPGKNWKPSPKWPDGRQAVVQLQSADYLAYEVGKFFKDQIRSESGREVRLSLDALSGIPLAQKHFTAKDLYEMCEECNIQLRCPVTAPSG